MSDEVASGLLAADLALMAIFDRPAAIGLRFGAAIGLACAFLLAGLPIEADETGADDPEAVREEIERRAHR